MSKILSDSNLEQAKSIAEKYVLLKSIHDENEKILENYKKNLFNIMFVEKKTKIDNVKLVEKNVINPMTIHEIKDCFNGEKVFEHIVVKVDIQATLTNLKIKLGMNENFAKKAIDKLLETTIISIPELEVLER